tara:strand:+ start:610 stop:813 length:204 start_codon:yes stop_codon:yes gene_type:complete
VCILALAAHACGQRAATAADKAPRDATLHPRSGRPQDFVLQATVASDISDTIAKDDEYYNDTTPAPI